MCTQTQDRQGTPALSASKMSLAKILAWINLSNIYMCSHWVHSRCSGLRNAVDYRRANGWICTTSPVWRHHRHAHLPHRLLPLTMSDKTQIQNLCLVAQSMQIKSVISVPIKDLIIIILGHCLTTYPGRGVLLRHTRVRAHFYDIPRSGPSLTTYPGQVRQDVQHTTVERQWYRQQTDGTKHLPRSAHSQSGGHSGVQAHSTIKKSKHPELHPSTTGSTSRPRRRLTVYIHNSVGFTRKTLSTTSKNDPHLKELTISIAYSTSRTYHT